MFSFLNAIDKLTLVISLASKRLGITDLIAYVSIYKAISSAATQIPPNKFMKTNIPIKNSLEKFKVTIFHKDKYDSFNFY